MSVESLPAWPVHTSVEKVRSIQKARKLRSQFFQDLFSDPAWDILLELYACELTQRRITLPQVCAATNVPKSTAWRWLDALEQRGLVLRDADRFSTNRYWVALSPEGRTAMQCYFNALVAESYPSFPI